MRERTIASHYVRAALGGAQHLHISAQTLRRHLREEGASFQALKDELRRDIAIYHLGRADLSLQEIAEQLGFVWAGLIAGKPELR